MTYHYLPAVLQTTCGRFFVPQVVSQQEANASTRRLVWEAPFFCHSQDDALQTARNAAHELEFAFTE